MIGGDGYNINFVIKGTILMRGFAPADDEASRVCRWRSGEASVQRPNQFRKGTILFFKFQVISCL